MEHNHEQQQEPKELTFDEFVEKYCDSFEQYKKLMMAAFPEYDHSRLERLYKGYTQCRYNQYVHFFKYPANHPGLILDPSDFDDDDAVNEHETKAIAHQMGEKCIQNHDDESLAVFPTIVGKPRSSQ